MNLKEFAEEYKLKIKRDTYDDPIIMGKFVRSTGKDRNENHHHIYEVNGKFFAYFNYNTAGKWNRVREELLLLGGKLGPLNCHVEGFIKFDPTCLPLVKVILKHVGARVKRQLTDEQKAAIRDRFAKKKV